MTEKRTPFVHRPPDGYRWGLSLLDEPEIVPIDDEHPRIRQRRQAVQLDRRIDAIVAFGGVDEDPGHER